MRTFAELVEVIEAPEPVGTRSLAELIETIEGPEQQIRPEVIRRVQTWAAPTQPLELRPAEEDLLIAMERADLMGGRVVSEADLPPLFREIRTEGFPNQVVEALRRGFEQIELDEMGEDVIEGKRPYDEVQRAYEDFRDREQYDPLDGNWIRRSFLGALKMAPHTVNSLIQAGAYGAVAGGAALAFGQAGPQIAAPEEAATVPIAFGAAFRAKMLQYWYKQGRGMFYLALRDRGVPHQVAVPVASGFALPYARIEQSQIKQFIRPGLKDVVAKTGLEVGLRAAGKFGLTWAKEVGEEVAQEIVQDSAERVGIAWTNWTEGTDIPQSTVGQSIGRWAQAGTESAGPLLFMMGPMSTAEAIQVTARHVARTAEREAIQKYLDTEEPSRGDIQELIPEVRSNAEERQEFQEALRREAEAAAEEAPAVSGLRAAARVHDGILEQAQIQALRGEASEIKGALLTFERQERGWGKGKAVMKPERAAEARQRLVEIDAEIEAWQGKAEAAPVGVGPPVVHRKPIIDRRLEENIAQTHARITELEFVQEELDRPNPRVQKLEGQLEDFERRALEEIGIPEPYSRDLAGRTPSQLATEVSKAGVAATQEEQKLAERINVALKEHNQTRQRIRQELRSGELFGTPILDTLRESILTKKGQRIPYGRGVTRYGGETQEALRGRSGKVRAYFRKVTKASQIGTDDTLDGVMPNLSERGVIPADASVTDLIEAMSREAERTTFEGRLEALIEAERETYAGWGEQAERQVGEWEALRDQMIEARLGAQDAAAELRMVKGHKLAVTLVPEAEEALARLRGDIQELQQLGRVVADERREAVEAEIGRLRGTLEGLERRADQRRLGIPQMRQRIMAIVKGKGLSKKRFEGLKKQFLGTTRLTKSQDAEALAKLVQAVSAEPAGVRITPAALAYAKQRGFTEKLHEFHPETAEEEIQDVLRRGLIRPSKPGANITLADVKRFEKALTAKAVRDAALDNEVGELVAEGERWGREPGKVPWVPAGAVARQDPWMQQAASIPQGMHRNLIRANRWCKRLDGGKPEGPHTAYVWDRASDAIDAEKVAKMDMQQAFMDKCKALGVKSGKMATTMREVLPGKMISQTEMLEVYFASKDEGKGLAVVRAEQFTEDEIGAIVRRMPAKLRALGDWWINVDNTHYWPLVRQTLAELKGIELQYVENHTMIVYEGKEYSLLADDLIDEFATRGMNRNWRQVERRFTLPRQGPAGTPVRLDGQGNILSAIARYEHFIHSAIPAYQLDKIINSPAWAEMVSKRLGRLYHRMFQTWLNDGFRVGPIQRADEAARLINKGRRNLALGYVGLNPLPMSRAGVSILASVAHEPHPWNVPMHIAAALQIARHPIQTRDFIFERFPAMRYRMHTIEMVMREIAESKTMAPWKRDVRLFAAWGWAFADAVTVRTSWLAHYMKALRLGSTEEEAIRRAKHAYEHTQPLARMIDLPALFRSGAMVKGFLMFQNMPSQIYNILTEDVGLLSVVGERRGYFGPAVLQPGAKGMAQATAKAAWTSFFAYILSNFVLGVIGRGRLPRTPKEVLKDQFYWGVGIVPFLGPFARSMGIGYGTLEPAVVSWLTSAGKGVKRGDWLRVAADVGAVGGIPTKGPERTVRGMYAILSRKDRRARRLLWTEYAMKPDHVTIQAARHAAELGVNIWDVPDYNKSGKVGKDEVEKYYDTERAGRLSEAVEALR